MRQALEKHGGNQTRTAQYLNIICSVLIYRMQKCGPQNLDPEAGDENTQPKSR